MRTIYYKEAPENVDSIASLLIDYLKRESPKTFWADNDELQCIENRNRSLDDLILLCNHYFPGTEIKDLLRGVIEANELLDSRNMCIPLYACSGIGRPVIHKKIFNSDSFSKVPVDGFESAEYSRNSEFNIKQIRSIANEIYAEK